MDNKNLTSIFEGTVHGDPLEEIVYLADKICPGIDRRQIREIHADLVGFFTGAHPDFQKSTMPYHNLRHSQMVVLATARIFHGLHCSRIRITDRTLFKGLLAAYFHDSGLLVQAGDPALSGTEYMDGHEARSINFLRQYATRKGFAEEFHRDCEIIIRYTDLESDPATFDFHSHEIQLAGQAVGSADILAQMADRYYLECLPLLYTEMEAGGINRHRSALELMDHTANFYHNVVLKRLIITFSNTSQAMRTHFRERYGIDRNLYIENIQKNIEYLDEIISKCDGIGCFPKYLKRLPPTT
jgi:hypothetical protein